MEGVQDIAQQALKQVASLQFQLGQQTPNLRAYRREMREYADLMMRDQLAALKQRVTVLESLLNSLTYTAEPPISPSVEDGIL